METTKISVHDIFPIIKERLDEGGEVVFTVTGNSMIPFMRDGKTLVTLIKVNKKLKRGDIVFYFDNNQFVLHRILRVKNNHIITCGDGLNRLEYINETNIYGIKLKLNYGCF